MPTEKPLKSAYELAMERLKTKDREDGVAEAKPLTAAQKTRIAELRQEAQAKLAEMEILHRKNLEKTDGDPAAVLKLEDNYRIDRARVDSRLESAIAKFKAGD